MNSLHAANINLGLRAYDAALQETARKLHGLKPSSVIALARKGPRLWQMMQEMGYELPSVPLWSDHALDFLRPEDLGTSPVIFDDVSILGTSLYRLQTRIKRQFNKDAKVAAVVMDRDNFTPQLVRDYWAARSFTASDTQHFSSELIRGIPLLGLPYDLDHPICTLNKADGYRLLTSLGEKATAIHRERLSLQYGEDYAVTVLHFEKTSTPVLKGFWSILGEPDLVKLKVFDSLHQDQLRFVSICCFAPLSKAYLSGVWKELELPIAVTEPLQMYRLLCFAAALEFAGTVDVRLGLTSLLWEEAQLVLATEGVEALRKTIATCQRMFRAEDVSLPSAAPITDQEISELGKAFDAVDTTGGLDAGETSTFERICAFWGSAYEQVESKFRQELQAAIAAGKPVGEVLESTNAKRLQGGLTAGSIFRRVQAESLLDRSLAMDLAVDSGVQVPLYAENSSIVGRVYHHGESVWDGFRLAALVARVFDAKKAQLQPINVIHTEKWFVILYELAVHRMAAMFSPVVHFLKNPEIMPLSMDSLRVDIEYRQHGRTLEVSSMHEGLQRDGTERWSESTPVIYWLQRGMNVFVRTPQGLVLSDKALSRFQAKVAVPPDVFRPVSKLFDFLARHLPNEVRLDDGQVFDRDEILRLLSSCPTRRQYLRSIAEDSVLVAQRMPKEGIDQKFWLSDESRGPCGEIYQKWRAFFFKDKVFAALRKHFEDTGFEDDFDLLIAPLFDDQDATKARGELKIEHRALTLFLCVESVALQEKPAPESNKQKAITWLQENGFALPLDRAGRLALAERVSREILHMFPALVRELGRTTETEPFDELFVFSDMRDSSAPSEKERAEEAKKVLISGLRRIAEQDPEFHFNDDLDDEKHIYAKSPSVGKHSISEILQVYSSHDKYARIGVVSSRDTLEKAKKPCALPSSPTNYILAKKIAHHLQKSDDAKFQSLDKRHAGQRHGILAVSKAARELIGIEAIIPGRKQFSSVEEFISSQDEGWVHVVDGSTPIGAANSPELHFSVCLYR